MFFIRSVYPGLTFMCLECNLIFPLQKTIFIMYNLSQVQTYFSLLAKCHRREICQRTCYINLFYPGRFLLSGQTFIGTILPLAHLGQQRRSFPVIICITSMAGKPSVWGRKLSVPINSKHVSIFYLALHCAINPKYLIL